MDFADQDAFSKLMLNYMPHGGFDPFQYARMCAASNSDLDAAGEGMAVRGSTAAVSLFAAVYGTISMAIWTAFASWAWFRHRVLAR